MRSSENHPRAEEKLAEGISEQLQLFLRTHAGQVRQGKQDAHFFSDEGWTGGLWSMQDKIEKSYVPT